MKPEDRLKLEEKAVETVDVNETEKRDEATQSLEVPEELPILPIRETVLYPKMILPIMVTQDRLIKLIDAALLANKMIGIVAIKNKDAEEAKPEDLFEVGCAAFILKMLKMPNNSLRLLIQGTARIRLTEYTQREPFIRAKVLPLADQGEKTTEIEAMMMGAKSNFQKVVELAPNLPAELAIMAMNIDEPGPLADLIVSVLNLPLADKQVLLETLPVKDRLEKAILFLAKEAFW